MSCKSGPSNPPNHYLIQVKGSTLLNLSTNDLPQEKKHCKYSHPAIAILRMSHKSIKNGRTIPFRLPKACRFQASEVIDTRFRMTSDNLTERTHNKTTKVLMVLMHQLEEPDENVVAML